MMLVALLTLAFPGGVQREWGPPPPVAPYGNDPLPAGREVHPLIFPLLGKTWRYRGGYDTPRGSHRHTGMDLAAPKMTPIVAPLSGTLGMKRETFWIWTDDGWGVLGTHLNDDNPGRRDHAGTRDVMFAPDLVPGQRVEAGRFLGYVGESGDATSPHLHFELYAPGNMSRGGRTRGNLRDPAPSLRAATHLAAPRVARSSYDERPPAGQIRLYGCARRVVPSEDGRPGTLTLILTSKEEPSGRTVAVTRVRYLRVRIAEATIRAIGNWGGLARIPATTVIAVDIDARTPPDDALAIRLLAPRFR